MPGIEITVWRHNSGTYRFRRPASGKIGQVRAEKSALALDHVTLRAGRFAKKERFASRCISCERHACACALQSSKVRDERLANRRSQKSKRRHRGVRHARPKNGENGGIRKLASVRSSGDIGRTLAALAVQAVTTGAIRGVGLIAVFCAPRPGILRRGGSRGFALAQGSRLGRGGQRQGERSTPEEIPQIAIFNSHFRRRSELLSHGENQRKQFHARKRDVGSSIHQVARPMSNEIDISAEKCCLAAPAACCAPEIAGRREVFRSQFRPLTISFSFNRFKLSDTVRQSSASWGIYAFDRLFVAKGHALSRCFLCRSGRRVAGWPLRGVPRRLVQTRTIC